MKALVYLLITAALVAGAFTLREGVGGYTLALGELSSIQTCDEKSRIESVCACYGFEREIPNPNHSLVCRTLRGCYGIRSCAKNTRP
jgi:hypothetical protein